MRLNFLLHDRMENLSNMSEILFCTLKWGLKGQNWDKTLFIPYWSTYLTVFERVKIKNVFIVSTEYLLTNITQRSMWNCKSNFTSWSDVKSFKDARNIDLHFQVGFEGTAQWPAFFIIIEVHIWQVSKG